MPRPPTSQPAPRFGSEAWRERFERALRGQSRWASLGAFFSVSRKAPVFIPHNRARFLADGREQLAWMLAGIAVARTRIDFEMYIVEDDDSGRRVRDELTRAAERGVFVRVLVDSVGSANAGPDFWRPLSEAGGHIIEFNPVAPWRLRISRIGKIQPWRPNARDHRKLLLVDAPTSWAEASEPPTGEVSGPFGSFAVVGGRNLGDAYVGYELGKGQWRDAAVLLFGPIVAELAHLFDAMWFHGEGADEKPPEFQCPHAGDAQIMAIGSQPGFLNLLQWSLAHAAWGVERELRVSCAYFIPSARWRRALRGITRRGAQCLLLLPKESDLPVVDAASRHFWGGLLAAKVRIFQHTREVLHEKTLIYDQQLSVLGSSNLDPRSFRLNYELSVLILCSTLAQAIVRNHQHNLEAAEPCSYEQWKARSPLSRFTDWFWSLFRHQL